ncbi:MAG: hypothetical protein WBH85_02350 [Thermoanaerobaculia bacterium]
MTEPTNGVHVATILGTSRPGNYTGKALKLVEEELKRRGARVTSVDPAELELGVGQSICPRVAIEAMVREEVEARQV